MKTTSRVAFITSALLLIASTLSAHDLFLRLDSFFVRPESVVVIKVLNGTFSKSENAITRDRLRDISVVGPRGRARIDRAARDHARGKRFQCLSRRRRHPGCACSSQARWRARKESNRAILEA